MFKEYFYGYKISDYGREHGRVDYRTLAESFDCVLNNNIVSSTGWENWMEDNGEWEYYEDSYGNYYTYDEKEEKIEELENEIEGLENDLYEIEDSESAEYAEIEKKIEEIREEIDELNTSHLREIFQYYIISSGGAEILSQNTNELVLYNEELDMYVWCVDHWGTSWDYVLTDIPCEKAE